MPIQLDSPQPFPGQTIPDATPTSGGLMTAAQAAKLAGLTSGGKVIQELIIPTSGQPPVYLDPTADIVQITTGLGAGFYHALLPDNDSDEKRIMQVTALPSAGIMVRLTYNGPGDTTFSVSGDTIIIFAHGHSPWKVLSKYAGGSATPVTFP